MVSPQHSTKPASEYKLFSRTNEHPVDMINEVRIQALLAETLLDRARDLMDDIDGPWTESLTNVSSLVFEANLIVAALCKDAYLATDRLTDAEFGAGENSK